MRPWEAGSLAVGWALESPWQPAWRALVGAGGTILMKHVAAVCCVAEVATVPQRSKIFLADRSVMFERFRSFNGNMTSSNVRINSAFVPSTMAGTARLKCTQAVSQIHTPMIQPLHACRQAVLSDVKRSRAAVNIVIQYCIQVLRLK